MSSITNSKRVPPAVGYTMMNMVMQGLSTLVESVPSGRFQSVLVASYVLNHVTLVWSMASHRMMASHMHWSVANWFNHRPHNIFLIYQFQCIYCPHWSPAFTLISDKYFHSPKMPLHYRYIRYLNCLLNVFCQCKRGIYLIFSLKHN